MPSRATIERILQAMVIFSTASLGAASGSLFRPEWPEIATAGVVSLGVMGFIAWQRHS